MMAPESERAWTQFVQGKTVAAAYEDGQWSVIQFTDGTKVEFVSDTFHMIEANRQ